MTATEPNPTAEHIDAVALMLADLDHYRRGNTLPVGTLGAVYRERAVRVLTSTDPAVHAAMLAALVRAGVLTERFAIRDEGGSVWLDAHGDHREAKPGGLEFADRGDAEGIAARPHEEVMRRYVTGWEVAP